MKRGNPSGSGESKVSSGKVGKHILVIEDEQNSREGLRQWLLADGHQVVTARDGWDALRVIKSQRLDVAVVDLDLPPVMGVTLSGWDLVRILRAYDDRVAVLVVSAEDWRTVRPQLEAFRVDGFLGKPIRLTLLRDMIRALGGASGPAARVGAVTECLPH
ncbi:MAG: response regulator [candidate division NC10 bacterium]|nr:response regulator [candidate division NC10 bacterium]